MDDSKKTVMILVAISSILISLLTRYIRIVHFERDNTNCKKEIRWIWGAIMGGLSLILAIVILMFVVN